MANNNNPKWYQEYFDHKEAERCAERLRKTFDGLGVEVKDQTWIGDSHGHSDGEYLYTSVILKSNGRYVCSIRNESELSDLLALAETLTGKQVTA